VEKKKSKKVIILGIDGMDFSFTQELLSQGKLKNIEILIKNGSFLPLISSNPSQSPVAWASLATGKDPGEHGIFDFIRINRKNYIPYLSIFNIKASPFASKPKYERIIKTKTFWEKLSNKGEKVKILKWPCTFPPFKIDGEFLAGFGVPDIKGGLGRYTFYTTSEIETKNKRGEIIKIDFKNKKTKAFIKGPFKQTLTGKKEVTLEVEFKISENQLIIKIGEKEFLLKEKEWSKWIPLEFKIGGLKYKGIAKFYLVSIKPEFKLYLSPINLSPDNELIELGYPPDYATKLLKKYGYFSTLGMSEDVNALNDEIFEDEDFISMADFLLKEKRNMFIGEIPETNYKIYAFVFETLDRIQHMFWERNPKIIEKYYIKFDKLIGELIERTGENWEFIIISDHGFGSLKKYVDLNAFLRENGYLILKEGMESEPLFKKVNFKKTKAFNCGFTGIYLNKKGREGKGTLKEGEYLKEKENLKKLLKTLRDGNKNVIKEVYDVEEIYSNKNKENMPDLIIGYEEGYRTDWESVIGGVGREIIKENINKWTGDHIFDPSFVPGVFISSFKVDIKNKIRAEEFGNIILNFLG